MGCLLHALSLLSLHQYVPLQATHDLSAVQSKSVGLWERRLPTKKAQNCVLAIHAFDRSAYLHKHLFNRHVQLRLKSSSLAKKRLSGFEHIYGCSRLFPYVCELHVGSRNVKALYRQQTKIAAIKLVCRARRIEGRLQLFIQAQNH